MLTVVEICLYDSCRRQRAKQRQDKLMKEFASKQKQFMEKVVGASGMQLCCYWKWCQDFDN